MNLLEEPNLDLSEPAGLPETDETVVKVEAKNANVFYGAFHALKNVSVSVPSRKVTAFIGPSGCGKSTFLRSINRMNDLVEGARFEGSMLIDGYDVYSPEVDPVSLRKRVGMVFQKPNPFPMSIFDNVAYGPRIHGIKDKSQLEEIVERCLRKSYLWEEVKDDMRKKSGNSLSGGQQQRLCIARTMAVDPEVILMDEPCSALDPIATQKIEELIEELKANFTIIIVTHNMQQAQRASDHTAFFYLGELIEFAPTVQLFTNPQLKQTEDYISGRYG